jgi:hypothetical protein
MRTYISILLLSLLSLAPKVNSQNIGSQTIQMSATDSGLLVPATNKLKDSRCENNPHCQRGSGRREFSRRHKDLTTAV